VTFDLLHRIRWTNVARAAAVALALLLALAWPRLRTHPNPLPPAVEPAPAAAAKPATAAKATHAPQAERGSETKALRGTTTARRARIRAVAKRSGAKRRPRHAHRRGKRSLRVVVRATTSTPTYVPPAVVTPAAEFRP
jgi:hypothetical protein